MSGCQLTASFIFDPCRCGNINAFCEACNKCQLSKKNAQDEKLRIEESGTRNCLFDWMMIDEDSDSSTNEDNIKDQRDNEALVCDMEKLDLDEKKPNIPTCTQLVKNHLLSVKHSIKVELCEAKKFCEIDVGFLSTQICGMLNTVTRGSIYLRVKTQEEWCHQRSQTGKAEEGQGMCERIWALKFIF